MCPSGQVGDGTTSPDFQTLLRDTKGKIPVKAQTATAPNIAVCLQIRLLSEVKGKWDFLWLVQPCSLDKKRQEKLFAL